MIQNSGFVCFFLLTHTEMCVDKHDMSVLLRFANMPLFVVVVLLVFL